MGAFAIHLDLNGVDRDLERLIGDDLPFTIARFLTMSAQDGQQAARLEEKRVFNLRNDWTTRNTKITPATKTKLIAEVYTDTSNWKTGAADYLPRQDSGGEKVPLAGRRFLAIPTRYLRKIVPGIIPDSLRPKNLLGPNAVIGQEYKGSLRRLGKSATPYPRTRTQHELLAHGEFIAFSQYTKTGTLCIFVRHGGVGFHGGTRDAEPWYTLVPEAHVKARFPMEQVVQQVVEANLQKNFDRAAAEVLVNNALASGLRVRF